MQRRRAALAAACLTLALAPTAAEAAGRCPGTTVTRVLAGKKTCVPAAKLRAVVRAKPALILAVNDAFGPLPLSAGARRMLGDLRPPPPLLPPVFKRLVLAQTPALYGQVTAAADAAQQPAAARRLLLAGPTITRDGVTATQRADGGINASGSMRATEGGKTVKLGVELGVDDKGSLDRIGFSLDYDDHKGGASFGLGYGGKSTLPACPDADGNIPGTLPSDTSYLKGERIRVAGQKLGQFSQSAKIKTRATIRGVLGPDAKLASILYDYQESFEIAHSGSALNFLQTSWVAKVTVKAKGRLDPKTGQPIGGASTITPTATSGTLSASERGALNTAMGKLGDERLQKALGDILKELRAVEANAQTPGKCVTIVADPAPTWSLRAGSTLNAKTTLKTNDGGVLVDTVDWTATASLGSIAPPTSKAAAPSFTITGAGPNGGKTAAVKWHAVSPAGIADLEGEAKDDPFPPRIVGTINVVQDLFFTHTTWTSSVVYVKDVDRTNPDGSRTVIYNLTTGTVTSGDWKQEPFGPCSDASGSITAPGGTLKAGDLEFIVGGTSPSTYKLLHDVAIDAHVVPHGCPPMVMPPPFDIPLGPFLNTGQQPFTAFPLVASGLPLNAPSSGTMSWSLDAG
jgi:hypothetical protein